MAAIETSVRATAAIDDLYRRHVGDVYRYTYAVLGNHADAEDVTQTTFVNALRALERGEEPQNPANWLLVIAHNIVRQRWRQAAARPTEVELVDDVPDVSGDDDVELDGLVRALQRIPPSQREALVMRELEGRSYQEISELLGLTTSALETLLFRARRSLAEELENVVTCQSAELAMSRRLDGRLARKESRRLDEHLAECASCAKLAATQARQRRAFKGLALIPLPVGLALFKGAPAASAASLPTIGLASTNGTTGLGAATAGGGRHGCRRLPRAGGVAAGGSLLGAAAVKVAAAVVAGVLVTGAAYQGAKTILDDAGPAGRREAGQRREGRLRESQPVSLTAGCGPAGHIRCRRLGAERSRSRRQSPTTRRSAPRLPTASQSAGRSDASRRRPPPGSGGQAPGTTPGGTAPPANEPRPRRRAHDTAESAAGQRPRRRARQPTGDAGIPPGNGAGGAPGTPQTPPGGGPGWRRAGHVRHHTSGRRLLDARNSSPRLSRRHGHIDEPAAHEPAASKARR